MKWYSIKNRFHHTRAPKVAVRRYVSWFWYLGAGVAVALVTAVVALGGAWMTWGESSGRYGESYYQARRDIDKLEADLADLRKRLSTKESEGQIARSTQQILLDKLYLAERENTELKEEIKILERLGIKGNSGKGVTLERVRITRDYSLPGRYRYRLLIAYQPSERHRVFKGTLQFVLNAQKLGGKMVKLTLPKRPDVGLSKYQLSVASVESKEGYLQVDEDLLVAEAEVRVLQRGRLRARQRVKVRIPETAFKTLDVLSGLLVSDADKTDKADSEPRAK